MTIPYKDAHELGWLVEADYKPYIPFRKWPGAATVTMTTTTMTTCAGVVLAVWLH
jgi:hypothetical protein